MDALALPLMTACYSHHMVRSTPHLPHVGRDRTVTYCLTCESSSEEKTSSKTEASVSTQHNFKPFTTTTPLNIGGEKKELSQDH